MASEKLEQWGGHFVLLGVVGGFVLGPLAILVYMAREFTDWHLGDWKIGQWPPGWPFEMVLPKRGFEQHMPPVIDTDGVLELELDEDDVELQTVTQLDRVEDMRTDLIFTLSGYVIGQTGQIGLIAGLVA